MSWNCKFCGTSEIEVEKRKYHTRWCKENPSRNRNQYTVAKEKGLSLDSPLKGRKNEKWKPHTDETKKILSEKMLKFLKENPEKHPWKRSQKFKSVPCENLKKELITKKINFVEEFSPFEKNYSIDIAIVEKKIAIEVNGNQHYESDGSLKAYYSQRHQYMEDRGWKVIEVHYTKVFDSDYVKKLIETING